MCYQCEGDGCAYCEGWFLTSDEKENSSSVKQIKKETSLKRLRSCERLDYEVLQLQRQERFY